MLKSLKKEMDEIPETNKSQRGILQDQLLVKGICSLIQLDYFRHKSQLKTADLNTSRTLLTHFISINLSPFTIIFEIFLYTHVVLL